MDQLSVDYVVQSLPQFLSTSVIWKFIAVVNRSICSYVILEEESFVRGIRSCLDFVSVEFSTFFVYTLGIYRIIYCIFLLFLLFQSQLTIDRMTPLNRKNCLLLPSFPDLFLPTPYATVHVFFFKKNFIPLSFLHTVTLSAKMWHKGGISKGISKSTYSHLLNSQIRKQSQEG